MTGQDEDALARRCIDKMLERDSFSNGLGIVLQEVGAGQASMSLQIAENMVNGHKTCHGGVIFSLADTTFACACNGSNEVTLAQGGSIEFLAPVLLHDTLTAHGVERKRGRQTGVCDVEVRNQAGKLVALFRGKSFNTGKSILEEKP